MDKIVFLAGTDEAGERLDKGVANAVGSLTRSYVQKLIAEGYATVNGQTAQASLKLREGDRVEVSMPELQQYHVAAEDISLDIVYEDECLIVLNKPAGMVVHPAVGNTTGTLVNALLNYCGDTLSGINGVMRPGIVHRLDKDTTGLLLVAKGDMAHLSLSEQLKSRTLKRSYFALVHNNIKEDSATIDKKIARSTSDRKKMSVTDNGRVARTHYTVLERFGKYTLVNCKLETGRTHQIRVHMRNIGHPVVGDKVYGVKNEEFSLSGQLLHAGGIGFFHPADGKYLEFSTPLPSSFERILSVLRQRK